MREGIKSWRKGGKKRESEQEMENKVRDGGESGLRERQDMCKLKGDHTKAWLCPKRPTDEGRRSRRHDHEYVVRSGDILSLSNSPSSLPKRVHFTGMNTNGVFYLSDTLGGSVTSCVVKNMAAV